jgi:4-amino-4-deoxy-L-arabinose transferase-like glycosyltransferase
MINFSQSYLGIILIALWTLPWKGVALWKAAGKKEKWWFIALLVLNTLGILEILYIFVFSKMKKQPIVGSPTIS